MDERQYAGFWIRTGASLIDTVLLLMVIGPVLTAIYGQEYWLGDSIVAGSWDIVFGYILPAIAVIAFWISRSATPGKMALKLTVVDAKTGGKLTPGQCVVRYLGYYVSAIPFLLGIVWVGFDRRKQGWHDKIAGTVVVRNRDL